MTEKTNDSSTPKPKKDRKLEDKLKLESMKVKTKVKKTDDIVRNLATRAKLERDYREDTIYVTFETSSQTKRMIEAKRPTHLEMLAIMQLSAEAAKYEGKADADSLGKMVQVYERLPILAAKLSSDSTLDADFWKEKVSFVTLQNFIMALIGETQKGVGPGGITPEEADSFRTK